MTKDNNKKPTGQTSKEVAKPPENEPKSTEVATTQLQPSPTTRDTDQASQLRSTLAIGQLLATKTPSAGNKLIAQELKRFSSALVHELAMLRKEVAQLPENLANSLKNVLESSNQNERRRAVFGSLPMANRRFPVLRRPMRVSLMFARRAATASAAAAAAANPRMADASTSTSSLLGAKSAPAAPSSNGTTQIASKTSWAYKAAAAATATTPAAGTRVGANAALDQITDPSARGRESAIKSTANPASAPQSPNYSPAADLAMATVIKHIWLPPLEHHATGYDGEADTDSDNTPPNSP